MTRRYFPAAWYHDGEWRDERPDGPTHIDVFERDPAPVWSGLYDAAGNKLMAADSPASVAFLKLK